MPAIHAYMWARDNSSSSEPEPEPGGRVSIDGGADKKGIVAMILATLLFIAVLIFYQYMAIVIARREPHAHPSPVLENEKTGDRTHIYVRWLLEGGKNLLVILKRAMTQESKAASDISSIDSATHLIGSSSRQPTRRHFLSNFCADRRKHYPKSKEARHTLRPLLLSKRTRNAPRCPIDDKTQEFLRSPHAFDFDGIATDEVSGQAEGSSSRHRRSRHHAVWIDKPIRVPERPAGAIVAPLDMRKKTKDQGREDLAVSLSARPPSAPAASSHVPLNVHSSPQTCLSNTQDPFQTHRRGKFLSVIPDEEDLRRSFFRTYTEEEYGEDGDVCKKLIESNSSRPRISHDETFTIGDLSDSDCSSDGTGH
ncbi:hypothetical protein EW145_g1738 [Phellinidium pouzarii]|uniref:Uncharacterized protein n=1 Tax=Phellinidium pouzarii TaxID=167371 RepID=A0A4V3XDI4_9AGAM|nr:hypothetical protein EW145_g1738 [Phellinidium pouzarii]